MNTLKFTGKTANAILHSVRLLGLPLLVLLLALNVSADDFFLKIEGVEGESKDPSHSKEIDLSTWTWGILNPATLGAPVGSNKSTEQEFRFTMQVNRASMPLALACAKGTVYPKATLSVRKNGNAANSSEYYKLILTSVRVTSFVQSGYSASEKPTETVTLLANVVEGEYAPVQPNGQVSQKIKFGWDFDKNLLPSSPVRSSAMNNSAAGTIEKVFGQNVTVSDPLETILNGQKYLSVEVTGPRLANSGVRAETSENLKQWFGAGILEQTLAVADDSTTIRYSIPMDKAQQFLRVVQ